MSPHRAVQAPAVTLRSVMYIAPEGVQEKHLKTSAKKERDKPNRRRERVVPMRQDKRTGLRPMWSDRRFHWNEVAASAT